MVLAWVVLAQPARLWGAGAFEAVLPPSVRAVWDLDRAYREAQAHGYLWHEFGDSHLIIGR